MSKYRIDPSEITPEHLYLTRRRFIKQLGIAAAGAVTLAACGPQPSPSATPSVASPSPDPTATASPLEPPPLPTLSAETDERGDELTSEASVNGYNNFYEFSFGKEQVAKLAEGFETSPWAVQVGGLVNKPTTFDLGDLLAFAQEERIYRMRCVEAWSMVIPWIGFPLSRLLELVEPTSDARYVRFETLYDPEQMPGQKNPSLKWPYVEGLRLDEAMHDLTILATGLYGKLLKPQTGAPIRLVVPWKYGFKSIKSIVKIDLVEDMPATMWVALAPNEYGFYANVNRNVTHPRWSQSTERRIGEVGRRDTLMFNGYDEVATLYEGMDLTKWY